MMSSTYKELSAFRKDENIPNIPEKKTPDRPEQLNLLDLNLIDTKPYVQSPCK